MSDEPRYTVSLGRNSGPLIIVRADNAEVLANHLKFLRRSNVPRELKNLAEELGFGPQK